MKNMAYICFLLSLATAASGCSMCASPYDYAYPAYGGKWERADRFHGRVGSAFSPAEVPPGEYVEGGYADGEYVEGETILSDEPAIISPPTGSGTRSPY